MILENVCDGRMINICCWFLLFSKLQYLWPFTVAASLMQVDRDFYVHTSAEILPQCTVAKNGTMQLLDAWLFWEIQKKRSLKQRSPRIIWSRPWVFKNVPTASLWWNESTKKMCDWLVLFVKRNYIKLSSSAGTVCMSGSIDPAQQSVVGIV